MEYSLADDAVTLVLCQVSCIQIFVTEYSQARASHESWVGKIYCSFLPFHGHISKTVEDTATVTVNPK